MSATTVVLSWITMPMLHATFTGVGYRWPERVSNDGSTKWQAGRRLPNFAGSGGRLGLGLDRQRRFSERRRCSIVQ